jgi:peptidoglycan hydrolase CwlO-like protein
MGRRILWAVAILEALLVLVAGCFAPSKPLVVIGDSGYQSSPAPKDREQVEKMDKAALQDEVLRLTAENDALRQDIEKQKREIKTLKNQVEDLKDKIEDLQDR